MLTALEWVDFADGATPPRPDTVIDVVLAGDDEEMLVERTYAKYILWHATGEHAVVRYRVYGEQPVTSV